MTTKCAGSWLDNHDQQHQCAHPVNHADNAYLCKRCTHTLQQRLTELPDLVADLYVTMGRRAKILERFLGRTNGPALFIDKRSADVHADLTRTLTRIVNYTHQPPEHRPTDHTAARAQWLLARLTRIRLHPAAGPILEALNDITRRLIQTIDLPIDLRTFTIGLCPQDDIIGALCIGEIRAHIPADDHKPALLRCTICGKEWPTWQWHAAGRRIRPLPRPEVPPIPPSPSGSQTGGRARMAYSGDDNDVLRGKVS